MSAEESRPGEPRDILSLPDDAGLHAVMAEIEARVARRREEGIYRDLEIQDLERDRLGEAKVIDLDPVHDLFTDPLQELSFMLQFARQFSDINTYYPIGARPGPLKPFIILVKRIIRRFMTPYMEVVFAKQRAFNEKLVRSLEAMVEILRVERERDYRGGVDRYTAWVEMGLRRQEAGLLEEAARRFEPERQVVNLYAGTGDFLEACAREIGGLVFPPLYYGECREQALMEANAADRDEIAAGMELDPANFAPGYMYQSVSEQYTNYHHLLIHMLHQVRSLGFRVAVLGAGHYPLLDHARAAVAVFHQAQRRVAARHAGRELSKQRRQPVRQGFDQAGARGNAQKTQPQRERAKQQQHHFDRELGHGRQGLDHGGKTAALDHAQCFCHFAFS